MTDVNWGRTFISQLLSQLLEPMQNQLGASEGQALKCNCHGSAGKQQTIMVRKLQLKQSSSLVHQ
jgi:hypothetical protein